MKRKTVERTTVEATFAALVTTAQEQLADGYTRDDLIAEFDMQAKIINLALAAQRVRVIRAIDAADCLEPASN
jgi:hypothetical protein